MSYDRLEKSIWFGNLRAPRVKMKICWEWDEQCAEVITWIMKVERLPILIQIIILFCWEYCSKFRSILWMEGHLYFVYVVWYFEKSPIIYRTSMRGALGFLWPSGCNVYNSCISYKNSLKIRFFSSFIFKFPETWWIAIVFIWIITRIISEADVFFKINSSLSV